MQRITKTVKGWGDSPATADGMARIKAGMTAAGDLDSLTKNISAPAARAVYT